MKGIKAVGLLFISLAILSSYPICQQSFAKNEKIGIRITAICDGSKLSNTKNNVYVLKPSEYRQYIDEKLSIEKMHVSGKAPLFLSTLPNGEYYIGVEIIFNTDVIKPEMISINNVMPLPEKYYIDDMYDGWGRGAHLSFGEDGIANFKFYFVKWYRVVVIDKIESVVALFLHKSESYGDWGRYYPSQKNYHIVYDSKAMNNIWDQASKLGIETSSQEKEKIINLLERGGKVYFPRNKKPNVFFIDSEERINFNSRLDIEEALEMQELFVNTNVLPASISISPPSKAKALPATLSPDIEKKFPTFKHKLIGSNEIRVYNPNDYSVYVAIRKENYGNNFLVSPQSTSSIYVSNGKHDIYFIYSNKPEALFQGDSFTLNNNGIEIKLVKVVGGNYGIRCVK